MQVDRDDPAARRLLGGEEIERRRVVGQVLPARVGVGQQLDHAAFLADVLDEDAVLRRGAAADVDHQVAAVLGRDPGEVPVLVIGPLVDQRVLRLRRAQPVEVQLVVVVGILVLVRRRRLVVAAVVEAAAVAAPGGARELRPAQQVGQVPAARHVPDVPVLPVGARRRDAVGEVSAVVAERDAGERDGAVLGEGVGVEQDAPGLGQVARDPEHGLVLQARVAEVPVELAHPLGDGPALVVPYLRQPGGDRIPPRHGREVRFGQGVLGLDPGLRLGRVDLLEPTVRVGDGGAVVAVDLIDPAGRRIVQTGGGVDGRHVGRVLGARPGGTSPPNRSTLGDVAQLVERLLCKQDVRGSSPLVSTAAHEGPRLHGGLVPSRSRFPYYRVWATSARAVPCPRRPVGAMTLCSRAVGGSSWAGR